MESDEDVGYNSADDYAYDEDHDSDHYHDDDIDVHQEETSASSLRRASREGKITPSKVPDGKFIITEYSEVIPMMELVINEVVSLLELDRDASQILLQSFRWDKERLIDSFFGNPEKVLAEAGLDKYSSEHILLATTTTTAATSSTGTTPRKSETWEDKTKFPCRICCDDCFLRDAISLGCLHRFCRTCYSEYLRQQVSDGPACIKAHCPEHKCKQSIPKSLFKALVEPAVVERYSTFVLRNFIESTKTMKYCPAPGCDKVAIGSGVTTVRCDCSYPFCFRCGEEAHDPCSCAQLAEWAQKCVNESETANWILANTKKCPKCNTRIEKNQGCNHMSCKLCKHEFCWICMGNWTDHGQTTGGYYKCNRYDAAAGKTDSSSSAAEKAKAELDRYLHYYQRFHGHDSALKFAAGQREAADRRMVERQETHRSTWIDVQFLKQAAEQVIDCRRVLKYTYVLGFFLEDESAEKQLFEHHQEMLEKNTEKLHEYTEQPLDEIDRTQVVNLTRVTERFMASLLSNMMEGGVVAAATGVTASSTNSSSSSSGSASASATVKTGTGKSKV